MHNRSVIEKADYYLDITADVCPMTFVRTRLLIERMNPGQTAQIRLKGEEPLKNVPASVAELGHKVESLSPESTGAEVYLLRIRTKS